MLREAALVLVIEGNLPRTNIASEQLRRDVYRLSIETTFEAYLIV